jgi:hypothetical protein
MDTTLYVCEHLDAGSSEGGKEDPSEKAQFKQQQVVFRDSEDTLRSWPPRMWKIPHLAMTLTSLPLPDCVGAVLECRSEFCIE